MTNFLVGQSYGENVMQPYSSPLANFFVIAAGDVPPNPSELLGSVHMQEVLEIISKSFDYIILDLPPVGIVSDALTVTKLLDGMLFVVREDYYDRRLLSESMRTLEGVDTKLIGMVVTRSTSQKKEYRRYNYKYGYGNDYGYGYGSTEKAAQAAAVSDTDADTDPSTFRQATTEFSTGTSGQAVAASGSGAFVSDAPFDVNPSVRTTVFYEGSDTPGQMAAFGTGVYGSSVSASSDDDKAAVSERYASEAYSDETAGRYEALK